MAINIIITNTKVTMSPSLQVSRRAIITKSSKDSGKVEFTTEDQWFSKERLYKVRLLSYLPTWPTDLPAYIPSRTAVIACFYKILLSS